MDLLSIYHKYSPRLNFLDGLPLKGTGGCYFYLTDFFRTVVSQQSISAKINLIPAKIRQVILYLVITTCLFYISHNKETVNGFVQELSF